MEKAARSILERQLPDGGFNIYIGGPADISATVKAYCALKLAGVAHRERRHAAHARRAFWRWADCRRPTATSKSTSACSASTRANMRPRFRRKSRCLPGDVLYEMSSWTRSILVPLSIVQARGNNRRAPAGFNLDELLRPGASLALPRRKGISLIFHHLDRAFKVWEKRGPKRVRGAAIRQAEKWMLDRTRHTEGLGAIYPAMMYFIMALDALSYPQDHPDRVEAIRHFESLLLETDSRFLFQPCVSPIWDTAICAFALGEAGAADDCAHDARRRTG